MIDAGCIVTQGSGSAVSFSRAIAEAERTDQSNDILRYKGGTSRINGSMTIVFHRPHPEPMIDPIMQQVFGKRLGKRFGWSMERFVEKQRGEPAS